MYKYTQLLTYLFCLSPMSALICDVLLVCIVYVCVYIVVVVVTQLLTMSLCVCVCSANGYAGQSACGKD